MSVPIVGASPAGEHGMTPTKLLIGQILIVFAIVLLGLWASTQWAAAMLGYQPQLGAPWFTIGELPFYRPWALFVWWSLQSHVVPYVVEVDALGEARAVAPAVAEYRPTDPQIAWHLGRFVANIRSVSLEPVLMREHWLSAYDFATERAALFLGEHARAAYAIGLVSLLGLSFHSLVDGMIYSVAFSANPIAGLMVAAGMIAHESPEGIVTYALLRCGGVGPGRAALLAFLAAGLTTPLGVATSYPVLEDMPPQSLGLMLALAAGALFHVGATHLLPQAEREQPVLGLVALLAGLLVVLATSLIGA